MTATAGDSLKGLKDFQRRTVDHVFERLYLTGKSRRFLVADEVGLGKTLIARGVIARAIEHLRGKVNRIDIVYVCSNAEIARQNVNRLQVSGEHAAIACRLTLLPREIERIRNSKTGVSLVSFTPATSFDLQDGLGKVDERVLLLGMLRDLWQLGGRAAALNVFQGSVGTDKFRDQCREFDLDKMDSSRASVEQFDKVIRAHDDEEQRAGRPGLRERFESLMQAYSRAGAAPPEPMVKERGRFVGELRTLLARSCIEALEPDLIILDEFQRFSHLLDDASEDSRLARELFSFKDVAVLLLSATPYKMYTEANDPNGDDHYKEFVRTVRFLERDSGGTQGLEHTLSAYRKAIIESVNGDPAAKVAPIRQALEERLRRIMVRTERLAATADRNGMLVEIASTPVTLNEEDVRAYVALQEVSRTIENPDIIEYWKSAPFVLNFVDEHYKLQRDLEESAEAPEVRGKIAKALAAARSATLNWPAIESYAPLGVSNGRIRALLTDTVENGAYQLLWVPPSLPYYQLAGPFSAPELQGFTKRLVFSSWRFAPRAIAACISYEAERRMAKAAGPGKNTPEARKKRPRRLRFARTEDRLTGMPILALMYPSVALARMCDPVELSKGTADVSAESLLSEAEHRIRFALEKHLKIGDQTEGPEDERWYWAAPLLLDRKLDSDATRAWFAQRRLARVWSTGEDDLEEGKETDALGWAEHVAEACQVAVEEAPKLGRPPADLARVLAQIAIGAPGVTMLRAMLRVVGMSTQALSSEAGVRVRNGAAQAAWSFRRLFDQPEIIPMLDGEEAYWRRVLRYCVDGCLQAVLDEYAHVLRYHLGVDNEEAGEKVHEIADEIRAAMALRTANLNVTDLGVSESGRTFHPEKRRMRCHYALRFGEERSETGEIATRADSVRKAFNSPFWPFVLATTSVGQEGLDFHPYCHAVVHWNLPSNPVDLEQREGRVHRYKGHAVRKNVALAHGEAVLERHETDPWEAMFADAVRARPVGSTDIVPFWVYSVEGGARIERHVPALPLSREHHKKRELTKSLAIYRMVFGQPRQDDLLQYLTQTAEPEKLAALLEQARIDLSPEGGL